MVQQFLQMAVWRTLKSSPPLSAKVGLSTHQLLLEVLTTSRVFRSLSYANSVSHPVSLCPSLVVQPCTRSGLCFE